jgi:two-component system nitrate/nitrite response regulator NarL
MGPNLTGFGADFVTVMDMIRAAIVDDHPLARRGIAQILTDSGRIAVVAEAPSPQELLVMLAAASVAPDVVICDLYLADDTPCLDAVAALATVQPTIVVSASGRPADVVGAISAGACGYITKHADPQMIIAAVETAAAGGFALSPHLADILYARARPAGQATAAPPAAKLSPREEQALSLIADGYTHQQVATRMGVSKATVETYVERIRAKLQVGNKAELTRAALERVRSSR